MKLSSPPFKRLLLLAACSLPLMGTAATYTWVPTATGTYEWETVNNWNPNTGVPNAVGDVANLNIDITAAQTIRLNTQVTLGTLNFGDMGGSLFSMTLSAAAGGSLVFQSLSGPAILARTTSIAPTLTDIISANITLNSPLQVNMPAVSSGNGIRLSGVISGGNGIHLTGVGIPTGSTSQILDLTNVNNSYTGETIISNGMLVYRGNVLSGQNGGLGNSTTAVKVGSPDSVIGSVTLQNSTTAQLRLQASNDTDNYVFERDLDFSGNTGTAAQVGRARFSFEGDGAGGLNTNTLTFTGNVILPSNGRGVEFLPVRQGMTIYFENQITSGTGAAGTIFWGPNSPGVGTDGRNNGTIRFSDLARTYTNGQSLTGGTMVIEGTVPATGPSPIGTQGIGLSDGNGGNITSANTSGANRRIFLATPGTSFARTLTPSSGSGYTIAAGVQALYGTGSLNIMNGYEFGGLNTSGTVTFSANITPGNLNVPVTGTAAGAGGTNVFTYVHNIALTAATGGTTAFTGIISGSTAPTPGSATPGATMAANNTRITINQFRNHGNLDINVDGIADPATANQLVGTATQGTVVFTAANTYGGGTEVLGGTLLVNNTAGSGTGTGAVTVTAGNLGGNGIITTTAGVRVAANAAIRPGDSEAAGGLGALTLNTPLTLNETGGSILGFQISRTTSDINAANLAANITPEGTINWASIVANTGGNFNKDAAVNNDTLVINGTLTVNTSGTTLVQISAAGNEDPYLYTAGMVWDLMDWTTVVNNSSSSYSFEVDSALQTILNQQGLILDTSRFWDTGFIAVIPEPSRALLLLAGLSAVLMRRRRAAC